MHKLPTPIAWLYAQVRSFAPPVCIAVVIRWLVLEAFFVPSPSMENALLPGDLVLVSKLHYGARTPATPLQVPLTHQHIWGTSMASYLDWLQLPMYRLRGFSRLKCGDVVVFNHPVAKGCPPDLTDYYVKRCVALAGDTLLVRSGAIVTPQGMHSPATLQQRYYLQGDIDADFLLSRGLRAVPIHQGYIVHATRTTAQELSQSPQVESCTPCIAPKDYANPLIYPHNKRMAWNEDNFGPLYIPHAGWSMPVTADNLACYGRLIAQHEGHKQVEYTGKKLYIANKACATYTFRKNYFAVMGDNRHDSADTRYWGLVPEELLVGKAVMVLLSKSPSGYYTQGLGIRWDRFLHRVR